MSQSEPPSSSARPRLPLFIIGKDSRGHWVVRDQRGLYGGLFINRAEALKFALFENGNRPQAVVMCPDVLEFDVDSYSAALTRPAPETLDITERKAA